MKFFKKSLITTIKLTFDASHIIEKIFWICLGLSGFSYIIYLLISQVISWDKNASFTTQKKLELSDIEFPAVTFCPRGATKYSIVERLGNLLDLNADKTKEKILPLRNALIQHTVGYPLDLSCSKQCVTELGNLCIFPFKFNGIVNDKCIEEKMNKFICPTKLDENGETINGISGQKYEECTYNCNIPCVTKDNKTCKFPFKYHGRSYNNCTRDKYMPNWNKYKWKKGKPWCASKVNETNYVIEKGYYCKKQCYEPSPGLLCSVSNCFQTFFVRTKSNIFY